MNYNDTLFLLAFLTLFEIIFTIIHTSQVGQVYPQSKLTKNDSYNLNESIKLINC